MGVYTCSFLNKKKYGLRIFQVINKPTSDFFACLTNAIREMNTLNISEQYKT